MLNKIFMTLFCVFIVLSLFQNTSIACGSLAKEMQLYWELEDKQKFFSSLNNFNYDESSYNANIDKVLLPIIYDAVTNHKINKDILKKTFLKYNCLHHARSSKKYSVVIKKLFDKKNKDFCGSKRFESIWFVAPKKGGVIRAKRNKSSDRIGVISYGMLLNVKKKDGDWFLIESKWGNGYMHKSILVKY